MLSVTLHEHYASYTPAATTDGGEQKENQGISELPNPLPSLSNAAGSQHDGRRHVSKNACRVNNCKSSLEDHTSGWESVRKRLGTLVAVKTVMDSQKKHRPKRPVDQKDFLEKFSTREHASMRNPKKHFGNSASLRSSFVQGNKICNKSLEKDTSKEECERKPLYEVQLKDTIVVDCPSEKDGDRNRLMKFNVDLSGFLCIFFEPYSNFVYYWLYLVNLAITYNSWVILLRVAFTDAQAQYQSLWFLFDYIADFIYVMDIVVSSRTSFLENGIYVNDLKRMAMAYLRSYQFALDAASVLPLDLFYFVVGTSPTLRLLRILKYYKTFGSQKTILALTTHPNVLRTIIFLHIMLIMMHWNACFYFIISKFEGFGVNSWVYPAFDGKTKTLSYQYAFCYYWSTLSLTTIGGSAHPETAFECVYMIVCYVIGIFVFASIVGQAGNVIQNMSATRFEFEKQRDSTIQYMNRHNVPEDMQRRVRLWYDYSYSRGRFQGNDINDMILLPNKMKTELALHVHLETLRRVTFLQKCQPEFLHDLVLKMKMTIYTPGDYVCRKGEIAREMYVISDGILEVISETGKVLKELHSGDFFGEIGILSLSKGQNRRTADVRAYGYVELFVLSKDEVLNATKEYPLAQKILAKYGRSRLKQDSNRNDGPRMDTTSSDSENERTASFVNVNGGQAINAKEQVISPHLRRKSYYRSLIRRGSEVSSFGQMRRPTDTDSRQSQALHSSEQLTQTPSAFYGTMMSTGNPAVNPISSTVSMKHQNLSEMKSTHPSVLINTNAVGNENEDARKVNAQEHRRVLSIEEERFLQVIKESQVELLGKMKQLFKKKMEENQKKILDRIKDLEVLTNQMNMEFDEIREIIVSKEVNQFHGNIDI